MNISRKCRLLSNSYYNKGLFCARERELSLAVLFLRKALQLNKNNIEARNLLGLIHYESGEVADALVQWVISTNVRESSNRASEYIRRIRNNEGELEKHEQSLSRFNQALINAQNGNPDVSIVILKRVVDSNPHYIKAQLLLALLYIDTNEYKKALASLNKVLKFDLANPTALRYINYIKSMRVDIRKPRQSKQFDENTVLSTSSYLENFGWQTVVNILIGLLIGASSILFLYMPRNTAKLNSIHNQEIVKVSEKLSDANIKVEELGYIIDKLNAEIDKMRENMNTIDEFNTGQFSQYQLLAGILNYYITEEYTEAARLYSMLDESSLVDIEDGSGVSVRSLYNFVSTKMRAEGPALLEAEADLLYAAGNYPKAIEYYDMALNINSDYVSSIYKKANAYLEVGDSETANTLFSDIIVNYPASDEAQRARSERGY